MEESFSYKNLIVWQKSMILAKQAYLLVRKFPAEERFALADQVRRAAVSVASNVAEGAGRASKGEYAHFLAIARGSLYETMTQLELAKEFGYIESYDEVGLMADEVSRMLTALIKKYTPHPNSNSNSNSNSNPDLNSNSNSNSNSINLN